MRISDWSSDVCSSDLERDIADAMSRFQVADKAEIIMHAPGRAGIDQRSPPRRDQRRGENQMQDEMRACHLPVGIGRSEEHTSELQSLMRISYAVFCLKKKKKNKRHTHATM